MSEGVIVEVGHLAPDFGLEDQHGQVFRLSDRRGVRNVLVVFYPFSFTRVCTGELEGLQREIGFFREHETEVVAISVDSMFAQRVFADQRGVGFPLLADFWPHGQTAQAYGVFDEERGVALRGSFLIDKEGVVRWKVVHAIPDARDMDAYMKAVAAL